MQVDANGYSSAYQALMSYLPGYYRGCLEMEAIQSAAGAMCDTAHENVSLTLNDAFIDTASEETIARLEAWLEIKLNKPRTLDERRRLIKSFISGGEKCSSSMIASIIASYTEAGVDVYLEPFDDEKNNCLYIDIKRGSNVSFYMDDIYLLLDRKIPAHIYYRPEIVYTHPIGVGRRRSSYKTDYIPSGVMSAGEIL